MILLQRGAEPWLGSSKFELEEVYNEHDIPLSGLAHDSAGNPVLFQCLSGHVEQINLWSYRRVTAQELEALDAAEDPESLRAVLADFATTSDALAAAIDGLGIIAWVEREDTPDLGVAIEFLDDKVREELANLQRLASQPSGLFDRELVGA